MKNINRSKVEYNQTVAKILGYGGLLPFIISNILVFYHPNNTNIFDMITIYSYCIISFLGGIYWGVGLYAKVNAIKYFIISTLPVILIFISLVLIFNQLYKFIFIIATLNLFLLLEIFYLKDTRLSKWFYTLRIRLNILFTLFLTILTINS